MCRTIFLGASRSISVEFNPNNNSGATNTVYLHIFEIFEDIEMYYTAILNKNQH